MKTLKSLLISLFLCGAAVGQGTPPQVVLTGSIGIPGSASMLGYQAITMTDATYTLAPNEWAHKFLKVTSSAALTATRSLVGPANPGQEFTVENATSGAQNILLIGPSGTGVAVPNGSTLSVSFDGVNYVAGTSGSVGPTGPTGPAGPTGPQGPSGSGTSSGVSTLLYGHEAYGDSNTAGLGYSPAYPAMISADANPGIGPFTNYGYSGDRCGDMNNVAFTNMVLTANTNPFRTEMIGTNDVLTDSNAASTPNQTAFTQCQTANMTHAATSPLNVFSTGSAPFTESGTWTTDTTYAANPGRNSTNGSSSGSVLVPTGVFYVLYNQLASGAGTAQVSIDGAVATDTITNASTLTTQPGVFVARRLTSYVAAARFVTTPGAHTIAITVAGGAFSTDGVIVPPAARVGGQYAPKLLTGGVIFYQNDPGDTTYPALKTYNALNKSIAASVLADGFNVAFVDVRSFVNATLDMAGTATQNCTAASAPGPHVNSCGTAHLAQAFEQTGAITTTSVSGPNFNKPIVMSVPADGTGAGPINDLNVNATLPPNGTWSSGIDFLKTAGLETRMGFVLNSGDGFNVYELQAQVPSNVGYTWCFHTGALTTPNAIPTTACPWALSNTQAVLGVPLKVSTLSLSPLGSTASASTDLAINPNVVGNGGTWAPGIDWLGAAGSGAVMRTALGTGGGGATSYQLQNLIDNTLSYSWCFYTKGSFPATPSALPTTACNATLTPTLFGLTVPMTVAGNITQTSGLFQPAITASTNAANTDIVVGGGGTSQTSWNPGIGWFGGSSARTALAAPGEGVSTYQLQSLLPATWDYSWGFTSGSALPTLPSGLPSNAVSMFLDQVNGLTLLSPLNVNGNVALGSAGNTFSVNTIGIAAVGANTDYVKLGTAGVSLHSNVAVFLDPASSPASGTTANSTIFDWRASFNIGGSVGVDDWQSSNILTGPASSPVSTLTFSHSSSGGSVSLPALVLRNVTGTAQCLAVDGSGNVVGTGVACGSSPGAIVTGSVAIPATADGCLTPTITMSGTVTASTTYAFSFSGDPGAAMASPSFWYIDSTHVGARLCASDSVETNAVTLTIAAAR